MGNPGFETAGSGGADVFANWVENEALGAITDETTLVNSGGHACKITQGMNGDASLDSEALIVSRAAGDVIIFSFYTRGDGTNAGSYNLFDNTNSTYLVSFRSTNVPGTIYTKVSHTIVLTAPTIHLTIGFWPSAVNTSAAYFDDVSVKSSRPSKSADYLAIIGHNLNTAGATVTLQQSIDKFVNDINDVFAPEAVTADTVYLKEFTKVENKSHWRLKIDGSLSEPPNMALCIWGEHTELDYATASFDPHAENVKANVNVSQGGFVTGIHKSYSERE